MLEKKKLQKPYNRTNMCIIILYTLYVIFVVFISIVFYFTLEGSELIGNSSISFCMNFPVFLLGSVAYCPLVSYLISRNAIFLFVTVVSVIINILGYLGVLLKRKKLLIIAPFYFLIDIIFIVSLNIKYHFYFNSIFFETNFYRGLCISIVLSILVDFVLFMMCINLYKTSFGQQSNDLQLTGD